MIAGEPHFGFWRPITAVRDADRDDDPATTRDTTWVRLSPPPISRNAAAIARRGAIAEVMEKASSSPTGGRSASAH